MKEILDSTLIKLLLAVCTILGTYLAISNEFGRLLLLILIVSIIVYLIPTKDALFKKSTTVNIQNQESQNNFLTNLGDFSLLLRKFDRYNIKSLERLDKKKLKEHIFPLLSGKPVGNDEFERQKSLENIDSLKKEILDSEYYFKAKIKLRLSKYDFTKNAFEIYLNFEGFTSDNLWIEFLNEKESVFDGFFSAQFPDKDAAKTWRDALCKSNDSLRSNHGSEKYEFNDIVELVVSIHDVRYMDYYETTIPSVKLKMQGIKFQTLSFP